MPKFIDLTGRTFNRWTVIKRAPDSATRPGAARWLCRCECGSIRVVKGQLLREGFSQSCGCYMREINHHLLIARTKTHGKSRTPTHRIWCLMRQRCNDPNIPAYAKYGAKGVRVCDRWGSFENFLADMGTRPSSLHSLDRFPNKSGHYEPGNVRWATQREQQNNRNNNFLVTFSGESLTCAAWSRKTGISARLIRRRISDMGWSIERALTERPDKRFTGRRLIP